MSVKNKPVLSQKLLSFKVARFILSKGFDLASCKGVALEELIDTSQFGILVPTDPAWKPREMLFGLIMREHRRAFLGTICFSKSVRGASKKYWVFKMHGRDEGELVKQLTEEMSSTFNVKIALRVVRGKPNFERYLSDK